MKKFLTILIPTFCIIMAFILVYKHCFMPTQKRDEAIEKYGLDFVEKFEALKPGDNIVLGKYEQDKNESNGTEDVEWQVLDIQDNKVLLLSKYVLDREDFSEANNSWDDSSIRFWMNNTFFENAFVQKEKSLIKITNNEGEYYGDSCSSKNSEECVFALSVEEAKKYFQTDESRKCSCTNSAMSHDTEDDMLSDWWLRSPGNRKFTAAYVDKSGYINESGCDLDEGYTIVKADEYETGGYVGTVTEEREVHIGFRPAMWISIYE